MAQDNPAPETVVPEATEDLVAADEIETLRAERDELRDRFMRALADAENSRKRADRDRREAEQYGSTRLARDLLPVYDNLKRALESASEETRAGASALIEGVELTLRELTNVMTKHGVTPISPNVGDQFSVGNTTQKTQNALDTLGQLRMALEQPADGIPGARVKLQDALNAAVSNLTSSADQVDNVRGSIGARENALTVQASANTSISLANTTTMSALANVDMGEAAINLTLQQTMLEASQLAFVKVSQLSLFNKM